MWFQLLPILILLAFSLLSYLPSLFMVQDPEFRWRPTTVHRAHRTTFQRGVSYYVDPVSFARHPYVTSTTTSKRRGGTVQRFSKDKSSPELLSFEQRVEEAWMKELYRQCEHAQEYKRRRLLDAQGFFGFGVCFYILTPGGPGQDCQDSSRSVRELRAAQSSIPYSCLNSVHRVEVHVIKNCRDFCSDDVGIGIYRYGI